MDGRNIGDVDVLVELAVSAGRPADRARRVLEAREFKTAVDEDWALSARSGITGVPTFIVGGQQVVGAQPEAVLRELLDAAGAVPRQFSDTGR